MKFSIEVDCTPEEARQFLGLPDVNAFQGELVQLIKERTFKHVEGMDPETIIRTWIPSGMEAVTAMQKVFMNSIAGASADKPDSKKE